jgi:hypothetical protein
LIGTDGADRFDANYYADNKYFNIDLFTHFLAGDGDDVMGGVVIEMTISGVVRVMIDQASKQYTFLRVEQYMYCRYLEEYDSCYQVLS